MFCCSLWLPEQKLFFFRMSVSLELPGSGCNIFFSCHHSLFFLYCKFSLIVLYLLDYQLNVIYGCSPAACGKMIEHDSYKLRFVLLRKRVSLMLD